jgi:predicted nucleic acid-binding protein
VSRFVLDASIVLTWCFPDEESQKAQEVAERIAGGDRVIVPAFWRYEMLNALLVGEKRKRLTPELTRSFIDDLDRLPVDLDIPSSAVVFNTVQTLCRKHSLTAYDAICITSKFRACTLCAGCRLSLPDWLTSMHSPRILRQSKLYTARISIV